MGETATKSEWHDILWYSSADTDLLLAGPWKNRKKLGLETYFGSPREQFGVVLFVVNWTQADLTLGAVFGELPTISGQRESQGWIRDGGTSGTKVLAPPPKELGEGASSVGVLRTFPAEFTADTYTPRVLAQIEPCEATLNLPIYVGGEGGVDGGESSREPTYGWTQQVVNGAYGIEGFSHDDQRFYDHYDCQCSAIGEEVREQWISQPTTYRSGFIIAAKIKHS